MTPNSPDNRNNQQSFKAFLNRVRSIDELTVPQVITLTGTVFRSKNEGMFLLFAENGEVIELQTQAVRSYQVLEERSGQPLVEIELVANETAPFVLITPHQAPSDAVEKMKLLSLAVSITGSKDVSLDRQT